MRNLESFKAAPIVKMFARRDFDRMGIEGWFFIAGFVFLFFGMILSSLRVLLWLGGLILFICLAAVVIWAWAKIR